MEGIVKVACVQAEPVVVRPRRRRSTSSTALAARSPRDGARLALFPETFIPVVPVEPLGALPRRRGGPSGDGRVFARLAQRVGRGSGPDSDRLGEIARDARALARRRRQRARARHDLQLAARLRARRESSRCTTASSMPTNHERLVWGLGDGSGLEAIADATSAGRRPDLLGEPDAARALRALRATASRSYLAPTADDSRGLARLDAAHRPRVARLRALAAASSSARRATPDDVPLAEGDDLHRPRRLGDPRADGTYLAGPLWDEEGILYADLDPARTRTRRGSASTRPATTTGRTSCASRPLSRNDPEAEARGREAAQLALQCVVDHVPPFRR